MVVQRSSDWGATWKPYRYFAEDCSQFPDIELGPIPSTIDEVICDDSYNKKVPSTKGEIVLKVLEPQLHKDLPDPYAPEVILKIILVFILCKVSKTNLLRLWNFSRSQIYESNF